MRFLQDEPPAELGPPAEGKKWIKSVEVVDGHDVERWIQVDDVEGPTWPARDTLRLLNHDIRRQDAVEKVTGAARYPHDARPPGMLYARILPCRVPRARVRLDLEPARALAGVHAVLGLVGDDGTAGETGFLGQPLAAVAAETPELCEDALRALGVELEPLPFAVTRDAALAEGAPVVSKRRGTNVFVGRNDVTGDEEAANAALDGAALVLERTYVNAIQHHCCLETHGAVVDWRGGDEAEIHASTQGNSGYLFRSPVPGRLGLDASRIRVRTEYMGGGFGSKFGPGVEGDVAARLSKLAGRPVHLFLSRADEFLFAGNRSGAVATLRGGVDGEGRLVGMVADVQRLGGVGDGSNPGQPYVYSVPTAWCRRSSVNTHTDASRAMRAPGHPQASFAIESFMDELAYELGKDPLELRLRNLEDPAYHRQLERAAREIGWFEHPNRTAPASVAAGEPVVGIGFGVATWGGGGRKGNVVEVRIGADGSVTAAVASQDLGTGTRTYLAAIVAEELGLEVAQVRARVGDSFLGAGTASGGSTTTASLAPAVKTASLAIARKLREHLAGALGVSAEEVRFEGGTVRAGARGLSWAEACETLPPAGLAATGEWSADLQASGVHGAQAAKVEVDPLTGRVRVLKMVAVQDCGLPLNRLALRSQLHGGMIQALSYALLEERVIDAGLGALLNPGFEDYKFAGVQELPELVPIIDDGDERNAVIGMAEPAVIPGASAIANAVYNACGARVRELPLTPDKVLGALAERS